jgi:hypothetical protein
VAFGEFLNLPVIAAGLLLMGPESAVLARDMMRAAFHFGGGHGLDHIQRAMDETLRSKS